MYTLTPHDTWAIGRIHAHLDHDCSLTTKGFCPVLESLEPAYLQMKDEESARLSGMVVQA